MAGAGRGVECTDGQAGRIPAEAALRPDAGASGGTGGFGRGNARKRLKDHETLRGQRRAAASSDSGQAYALAEAEIATVGSPRGCGTRGHVRSAKAPRNAFALRLPAGHRWDAEIVGGAEGAFAEPRGQTAGGADGGSSAGLRQFRGQNSRRKLRRGNGDGVGPRNIRGGRRA